MRPVLLDLFCGAGGAARGYQQAGFRVVGVDIQRQPRYCGDELHQADALEFLERYGREFDAIHASPPCQAFTTANARYRGRGGLADSHPDLLRPTRDALCRMDKPWVIENVVGARHAMGNVIVLHGGMFGLRVHRPRLFESNVLLLVSPAPKVPVCVGVYGDRHDGRLLNSRTKQAVPARAARSLEEGSEAMGIDWMTWRELTQAIPPAYTEHVGRQLIRACTMEAVS